MCLEPSGPDSEGAFRTEKETTCTRASCNMHARCTRAGRWAARKRHVRGMQAVWLSQRTWAWARCRGGRAARARSAQAVWCSSGEASSALGPPSVASRHLVSYALASVVACLQDWRRGVARTSERGTRRLRAVVRWLFLQVKHTCAGSGQAQVCLERGGTGEVSVRSCAALKIEEEACRVGCVKSRGEGRRRGRRWRDRQGVIGKV